MRFFRGLFREKDDRRLAQGRGWIVEVHGESHYQAGIEYQYQSNGGTEHDLKVTAVLIPEKENQYDANAVRIEIGGDTVGYLPRIAAAEYRNALGVERGQCSAKIVGGFLLDDGAQASFGVKLNLAWPPRFESR